MICFSAVIVYVYHMEYVSRREITRFRGFLNPPSQLHILARNLKILRVAGLAVVLLKSWENKCDDQTTWRSKVVIAFVYRMQQNRIFSRRGPSDNDFTILSFVSKF